MSKTPKLSRLKTATTQGLLPFEGSQTPGETPEPVTQESVTPESPEPVTDPLPALPGPVELVALESLTLEGPAESMTPEPVRSVTLEQAVPVASGPMASGTLDRRALTAAEFLGLAEVPPELEWFANIRNERTRRAYQQDVRDFTAFVGIERPEEFRIVTRAHLIAWRKELERRELAPASIRRLIRAGRLPLVKLGRAARIDPADLSALVYASKARPAQPEALCHSTKEVPSGGFASPRRTAEKYGKLLKLPTDGRRKNTTTGAKPISGQQGIAWTTQIINHLSARAVRVNGTTMQDGAEAAWIGRTNRAQSGIAQIAAGRRRSTGRKRRSSRRNRHPPSGGFFSMV